MLRGMQRAGIAPGEDAFASTMEAFAERGDVDQVLALLKVTRLAFASSIFVVIVDIVDIVVAFNVTLLTVV